MKWVLWLVGCIVVAGVLVFWFPSKAAQVPERLHDVATGVQEPTPVATITIRDAPAIVSSIQVLGTLETAAYTVEKRVELERNQAILFGIQDSEIVQIDARATVYAGVDFSAITIGDVAVQGSSVTVVLPGATITHLVPDESTMKPVLHSTSLFGKPTDELVQKVRQTALDAIRLKAIENGICRDANTNAQAQIRTMLAKLGFSKIDISSNERACQ